MKKRLIGITTLVLLISLLLQTGTVWAQNYLFQVPRAVVNFFIREDGTASIEYIYDFVNLPQGHVIDYVDIGVPQTNDYDIKSVTAEVNGKKITDIQKSDVVTPGIAFGLGANSIRPGSSGTFHAYIGVVRKIIFESDLTNEKEAYASISFSPSWFDPDITRGTTNYTVNIYFPAALEQTEPRYHKPESWPGPSVPFTGVDSVTGLKYYSWQYETANAYTQYKFGASFPARLVPANTIQPKVLFTLPPLEDLICWGFAGIFVLIIGMSIYGAIWGANKRKLKYLPPKIAIEGMGIKRGLTSVEAAILMEQPLDKILTMILFSTIKKGAASVVSKDPLTIQAVNPLPESLYGYEKEFLTAFEKENQKNRRQLLQTMMINLVKSVTEKMKGFSRKETIAYYESIVKQAWQQVETAATPEVKMQSFDDNLDWTMLDRRFEDRTRDVFRTGPVYVPVWWGRYDPTFKPASTPSFGGASSGQPITISRTSLPGADFAASVVNSVQGFAGKVVGDVTSFTGGITDKTNPIPVSTSSGTRSGGSSGGHSCACACACACAGCACACAGGGR